MHTHQADHVELTVSVNLDTLVNSTSETVMQIFQDDKLFINNF